MSTRSSIKHDWNAETGVGFNLYTDWLDDCAGTDVVHLEMNGVAFEASSGGRVEVTMPRTMAEKLGLVPAAAT